MVCAEQRTCVLPVKAVDDQGAVMLAALQAFELQPSLVCGERRSDGASTVGNQGLLLQCLIM